MKPLAVWKPEMEEQVYRLALLGATKAQIAEFYGISIKLVEDWICYNPEFDRAWRRGTAEADMNVVKALYRKAVGYTYKETTNYTRLNAETGELMIVKQEIVEKHHSPDAFACLKWLALRQKQQWAEVSKTSVEVNHTGIIDINMVQEQLKSPELSIDELKVALKLGLTKIAQDASN